MYSFFPRTIPEWNQFPSDIVHGDTLDSFTLSIITCNYNCTCKLAICPGWALLID